MRYRMLRFDIWLCLLLSFLISNVPANLVGSYLDKKYDSHLEEHKVDSGEIGGIASDDAFEVQSVEDILSHDTFTIRSKGIEYRNRGAGYYHGMYLYAVTLLSGERVAARINSDSVKNLGDDIFSGDNILPMGKVIKADLTDDKYFLEQIEHSEELSRKDFYIDMVGGAEVSSKEDFVETPKLGIQILTIFIMFPIFHAIGAKLGIFPYFIAPKNKKESEWE